MLLLDLEPLAQQLFGVPLKFLEELLVLLFLSTSFSVRRLLELLEEGVLTSDFSENGFLSRVL